MTKKMIVRGIFPILLLLMCAGAFGQEASVPSGEMQMVGADGQIKGICPLEHTDVVADISGYVGRVHVRQNFSNPSQHKIEAVYTFPLPHDAAVDDMTMIIGDRRIQGVVQPKEDARKTYETAKSHGKVAALLDQERPNIFTQSVANIEPGAKIVVDISYVETLKFEDGVYEWVFPMVVGPRYIPGAGQVPDASRITPPMAPPPTRAGHDISLLVHIDTGAGLSEVKSPSHAVATAMDGAGRASVSLQSGAAIPNKDFILRYRSATDQITDAFLTFTDTRGKYFTLFLQPPRRVVPAQTVPKEMIFVIDQTGSQAGWPLEKAKETMRYCIQNLNPGDTFNLIGFNTDVFPCFPKPVPATRDTIAKALQFLEPIQGNGGTDILKSVQYALKLPDDPARLRLVCYMTDGYVGNDFAILDYIQKNRGRARMFPFGVGQSVNRFLIDGMARMGSGEPDYVTLSESGEEAARKFYQRVQAPVLTNIHIDWGTLPVADIYPKAIPDLFSGQPIMIHGRLTGPSEGTITLSGETAAGPFARSLAVTPEDEDTHHEALPSLWARAKVSDLMSQDLAGLQSGSIAPDIKQQIVQLGVEYRLMTQFTSFVAVEEDRQTTGAPGKTVAVPVEVPEGVDASHVFVGGMAAANGPALASVSAFAGKMGSAATTFHAAEPSTFASRSGDPLISIGAPRDARKVVALMPGGGIKPLVFNPDSRCWEARFDIPGTAPDGDYTITALFVLRDGSRRSVTLRYRVDTTAPAGTGSARLLSGMAPQIRLELDADPDTARVAALLPWKARLDLTTDRPGHFTGLAALPREYQGVASRVTYILTDRAHNRTTITVDMSR